MACLDSVRAVYVVFFVPTAYLHSLRCLLFQEKKEKSVFIALFPFWESYFSISPLRGRLELSGRKTVKIINISIYNSRFEGSTESCSSFVPIAFSARLFCCVSIAREMPSDCSAAHHRPRSRDLAHGDGEWEILNKHRAREMKTCAIEIRIGKFQFLLSLQTLRLCFWFSD